MISRNWSQSENMRERNWVLGTIGTNAGMESKTKEESIPEDGRVMENGAVGRNFRTCSSSGWLEYRKMWICG